MSAESLDYYDVQNMIRDACIELRNEYGRELTDLRRELLGECDELRDEVRSLERTLASRTEHLA